RRVGRFGGADAGLVRASRPRAGDFGYYRMLPRERCRPRTSGTPAGGGRRSGRRLRHMTRFYFRGDASRTSAPVKGFGCGPVVTDPPLLNVGVRKPPRKEPAGLGCAPAIFGMMSAPPSMSGHMAADLGQIGVGDAGLVDEPAVEHDDEAIGDFENFVEIA